MILTSWQNYDEVKTFNVYLGQAELTKLSKKKHFLFCSQGAILLPADKQGITESRIALM